MRRMRATFTVAVVALASVVAAAAPAVAVPGAQLWVKAYNGPANGFDGARSLATSPDSNTVYVTGVSTGATAFDYATAAYNAATGAQVWLVRYDGPVHGNDDSRSIVVSPDGSEVFVTGASAGTNASDYATIAYRASDGTQLWIARYDAPAHGNDQANKVSVSPDGSDVFVTGGSAGPNGTDYATVAYNAVSGAQLWVAGYNGAANLNDEAVDIAVGADGTTVFVTGSSESIFSGSRGDDYATIAYNALNGTQLWATRFDAGHQQDTAKALAVSPDGTKVFVTGWSALTPSAYDYGTVAYNTADGGQLWAQRYNGPPGGLDFVSGIAVSPNGAKVFVTGASPQSGSNGDFATVAYNTTGGTQLWVKTYNGPANSYDSATGVAVSPDGTKVFVTGWSRDASNLYTDYATVVYASGDGTTRWFKRFNAPGNSIDRPTDIAVTADGTKVIVTGLTGDASPKADWQTIAYSVT